MLPNLQKILAAWKDDPLSTIGGIALLVYTLVDQIGGTVDTSVVDSAAEETFPWVKLIAGMVAALVLSWTKISPAIKK